MAGKAAYLGRGGPELLEEVREEGRVMLQLGQDLHIVEQHHALQGSKCLVVENLNRTHNFTQTEIVDQARSRLDVRLTNQALPSGKGQVDATYYH